MTRTKGDHKGGEEGVPQGVPEVEVLGHSAEVGQAHPLPFPEGEDQGAEEGPGEEGQEEEDGGKDQKVGKVPVPHRVQKRAKAALQEKPSPPLPCPVRGS
ncbi:hypothetical protein TthTMY_12270 [Thermus thermophilus]|nr:hypothetical protein TthTMY_12270 [Thermus thermophilus]